MSVTKEEGSKLVLSVMKLPRLIQCCQLSQSQGTPFTGKQEWLVTG